MDLLAAEEHERGRVVVLVLDFSDEGHLLGRRPTRRARAPEQQRVDSHSPFACLLVGQPTLRRRIKLGTFARPAHRPALRDEQHDRPGDRQVRVKSPRAGRSDTLFSDDALGLIHQVSRGLPRAVNNLAIQALVAAYATKKVIVDESSARAAVTEVTAE